MTNAAYWLTFVANGDDPEQGCLLIGLPARNDADAWRAGLVQAALLAAGHECSAEYEVRSQIGPTDDGDGIVTTTTVVTRGPVKLPEPPADPGMTFVRDDLEVIRTALRYYRAPAANPLLARITNHLNPPAPPAANEGEQPHG